ncbi:unnamed protein product [Soboliphyme baturini]|uniref:Cholinesterase n=1 Tax=Soboliphyme baturini TaxID=241478 RepID=A0A183IE85_9BILA|nr:unnamed protein product [Soboliphyme baturini]
MRNPNINPDHTWTHELWPQYTKNETYLILSATENGTGHGPRRRQCAFWEDYFPRLYTATANLSEMEIKWKLQMAKWEDEYITDWKHHFEQYKRLQNNYYTESRCNGDT